MLRLGDPLTDLPVNLLRSQTGTSNTRMIFNTPSPLRIQRRSRNINLVPISYASPSTAYRTLSYQLLAQFHSFGL